MLWEGIRMNARSDYTLGETYLAQPPFFLKPQGRALLVPDRHDMIPWDTNSFSEHLSSHSTALFKSSGDVQSYTTVSPSQGFHITSTTTISGLAPFKHCFVGSLQFVPPDFIVDEYELRQRYQEGYGPLCYVIGETDLELPVQAVGSRPAAVLAEVTKSEMEINIPLHLRYPHPQKDAGHVELKLPWPRTVVMCGKGHDGHQSLDRIFNNKTITAPYFLPPLPNTSDHFSRILVPTGNTAHQLWVEIGTLMAVLATFLYVAWSLQRYHHANSLKIKKS